jgi:hypothetical protein
LVVRLPIKIGDTAQRGQAATKDGTVVKKVKRVKIKTLKRPAWFW